MAAMDVLEERDNVLQELLNTMSTDLNKLNISDIVLRYFESKRKKRITINPWAYSDPAVRQLTSARKNALRHDYFRRIAPTETRQTSARSVAAMLIEKQKEDRRQRLEKLRELQMQALRSEHDQQVARQLSFQVSSKKSGKDMPMDDVSKRQSAAPTSSVGHASESGLLAPVAPAAAQSALSAREASYLSRTSADARPISQLSEVAHELVDGALTYAAIEREISEVAQRIARDALAHSEVDALLTDYVAELITDAMTKSKSAFSLQNDKSMIEITPEEQERIELIAQDMVSQVIQDAVNSSHENTVAEPEN